MPDEKRQQLKDIFDAALQQKPDEREQFIVENCAGDETLEIEIKSLLSSHDNAQSFLEKPVIGEVADVITQNISDKRGKVFGHYEIIKQIGVGGMGEVYLAKDTKLERQVAVKILNEKFSKHESNVERFVKEAKSASALNHPNILVIHEIGFSDEANYIISEFIEGSTLRQIIENALLNLSEILDICIQIANALTAAHAAKLVHRDIKPENIMIRPDGYVKILDFGLAKLVEPKNIGFEASTVKQNQTAKGIIMGTVNYMSSEQAKGEKIDERTDIFSFGAVLYEMIAGRTPFAGNTMSETFANLINAEPQLLTRYSSNVPEELERIVAKMLRKNKDERYQTMKGLLADLKSLRENLAFDELLEKSPSPHEKNATAFLKATTGDFVQLTGEANNFSNQIRRHKSLALIALIVGAIIFGYYFYNSKKSSLSANVKKSLAVLPFVNASQDANAEYLSDGVTESIINNLSQITGLKVMSRNSAFRFKTNQTDTKNIASQLGVEMLVMGDIKQLGDKLIIDVRLIDAADDSQIWGNQYVKTSDDIIAAQNEIAQAVANNLRLKLTNAEQQKLGKNYTENIEAYRFYLQARYHTLKSTPPEIRQGIAFYQQAIDADPLYALAYAGMADAYRTLPITSDVPPNDAFQQAKASAKKELEIDMNLAEAHIVLGYVGFWFEHDWKNAESEITKAVAIRPNNSEVHRAYAIMLTCLGRFDEAIAEMELARELDPLSLITNALKGQTLFYAGHDLDAIVQSNKTLEIEPDFWISHLMLARVYLRQNKFDQAFAEAKKAEQFSGGNSEAVSLAGYALAKNGQTKEAQQTLEELKSRANERYVPAYNIAMVENGLGATDEALNSLEKAFADHDARIILLKVEPKWNNLRSEPRFIELMRHIGLPQ